MTVPGGCGKCDATWTGERICHCAACHETFLSLAGFDGHRVGDHYTGTRRCMTAEEMQEAGYQPNKHGRLRTPNTTNQYWKDEN